MSLRQIHRRSASALRDGGLLRAIRAELSHEISSSPPPYKSQVGTPVGSFVIDWDDFRTQDVILRRRVGPEDVAVSGILGPLRFNGDDPVPREALMKVCIKKAGLDPVLHFHCCVFDHGFSVRCTHYHRSVDIPGPDKYTGPSFRSLDPQLQSALKEYLASRGIDEELTSFLLQYLRQKEGGQYIDWLRAVEGIVAKDS